ncbi:MAG: cobalamin biosynthesis protein CbiX [Pseudomonas sp.]|nr:cobalamin biosynthesis protein CbiX [Pseudomonas sp.]
MSDSHTASQRATILLAHGSTDPNWLAPFDGLLDGIRAGLTTERVELAYMELAEPSLENQVRTLVAEGFTAIDVLPLFFAAGRHLRKDVPRMLDALSEELASNSPAELNLHPPVGLDPEVASALSRIVLKKITASA